MLKKLRIQNFKLWKDTGTINMAPITLFFGANSSGKSSIGQFLMMLKQTVESADRKTVFNPGGKNSAVQLGSYQDMVFQRDRENKIMFEYQWDYLYFGIDGIVFEAEVALTAKDQHPLVVDIMKYQLTNKGVSVFLVGLKRKTESDSEIFS